jgi:hypothetical protein
MILHHRLGSSVLGREERTDGLKPVGISSGLYAALKGPHFHGSGYVQGQFHFVLDAVGALADQGEELGAGFLFLAETAEHRGSDGGRVLFFDATHHHAEVAGFDDDSDALGLDHFLDRLGDLGGEALLNLQATRKEFDEARDFAEADDTSVGDVGDVNLAEEREQVVLAEAEDLDVFDDDHFIVVHGEERTFQQGLGIFLISLGEELHGFVDALGSGGKAFAVGIFAEADNGFADEVFVSGAG